MFQQNGMVMLSEAELEEQLKLSFDSGYSEGQKEADNKRLAFTPTEEKALKKILRIITTLTWNRDAIVIDGEEIDSNGFYTILTKLGIEDLETYDY